MHAKARKVEKAGGSQPKRVFLGERERERQIGEKSEESEEGGLYRYTHARIRSVENGDLQWGFLGWAAQERPFSLSAQHGDGSMERMLGLPDARCPDFEV